LFGEQVELGLGELEQITDRGTVEE